MMSETSNPATMIRRAKACNTCRRKKTKCDGKRPICSSCNAFNLPCTFQDVLKHPNRSSRTYVEELEKHVKNMEEQLQQQNRNRLVTGNGPDSPLQLPERVATTLGDDEPTYNSLVDGQAGEHNDEPENEGDGVSCVINPSDGRMRFFGASAGFSVASSRGTNLIENRAFTEVWNSAGRRSAGRWQLASWYPRTLQDDFDNRMSLPLPGKEEMLQLVREYFSTFNRAFPLFSESMFMGLLERQFSWNPTESPSWRAALNVVLAFAYRERAQASSDGSDDWKKSLCHIKNSMNVVIELFMRTADLLAVQGLLGLALYFQSTPNPQPLFMFAAAAVRLAQSIGLHRGQSFGLSSSEIEERRRTFWISFILDADISLRTGRPPVQDLKDYDTPLPTESPSDGQGTFNFDGVQMNFFRLLAEFALIQRRIYQNLYSVSVQRQGRDNLINEVKACEAALQGWKRLIPAELQPQPLFSPPARTYFLQHILRLHFAYHCCYANLHKFCVLGRRTANKAPLEHIPMLESEIIQTLSSSLESARSAVGLSKYVHLFGSSYPWCILYFPSAASAILALRILVSPTHQHAKTDISLIRETISFLTKISSQEPGTYVDYILSVCSDFEDAAQRALDLATRNRPNGQSEGIGLSSADNGNSCTVRVARDTDTLTGNLNATNNTVAEMTEPPRDDRVMFDPTSDLLNWQWPIPPFGNWQDIMAGISPFTSNPDNGQELETTFSS